MRGNEIIEGDRICVKFDDSMEPGLWTVNSSVVWDGTTLKGDQEAVLEALACEKPAHDYTWFAILPALLLAILFVWRLQYKKAERKYGKHDDRRPREHSERE